MNILKSFMAIVVVLIVAGCTSQGTNSSDTKLITEKLEYRVLIDNKNGNTYSENILNAENAILNNQQEWAEFLNRISSPNPLNPAPRAVDFTKTTVVGSFESYSTGGYLVEITDVSRTNGKVLINVKKVIPGSGCTNIGTLTTPYQLVEIPKTAKLSIEFKDTIVSKDCPLDFVN